jgi:hypothetical protein
MLPQRHFTHDVDPHDDSHSRDILTQLAHVWYLFSGSAQGISVRRATVGGASIDGACPEACSSGEACRSLPGVGAGACPLGAVGSTLFEGSEVATGLGVVVGLVSIDGSSYLHCPSNEKPQCISTIAITVALLFPTKNITATMTAPRMKDT